MDHEKLLADADFQRLLHRRSRLRWSLTALLVAAYLGYGLVGIYAPGILSRPIAGSAVSSGVVIGYGIIVLGIASSIFYVWQVNRIIAPLQQKLAKEYR